MLLIENFAYEVTSDEYVRTAREMAVVRIEDYLATSPNDKDVSVFTSAIAQMKSKMK
jgi:hypothetical protein